MDKEERKKIRQMKDRIRKKAQRERCKENVLDWNKKRAVLNEKEKKRYLKVHSALDAVGQAEMRKKWRIQKRKYRESRSTSLSSDSTYVTAEDALSLDIMSSSCIDKENNNNLIVPNAGELKRCIQSFPVGGADVERLLMDKTAEAALFPLPSSSAEATDDTLPITLDKLDSVEINTEQTICHDFLQKMQNMEFQTQSSSSSRNMSLFEYDQNNETNLYRYFFESEHFPSEETALNWFVDYGS